MEPNVAAGHTVHVFVYLSRDDMGGEYSAVARLECLLECAAGMRTRAVIDCCRMSTRCMPQSPVSPAHPNPEPRTLNPHQP